MPPGLTVGLQCKLYYNTGTYGTPIWAIISTVKDLKINLTKGVADASSRLSTWKEIIPVLKEASVEFEILADLSLPFYDVLKLAYINDTVMDIAVANGLITITGNEYFRADQVITQWTRNEPLENIASISIKTELAYSVDPPGFLTVP